MDEQRTDKWFQDRIGCVTASEVHNIMSALRSGGESAGRKKYRTKLVIETISGVPMPSYSSSSMDWGVEFEPVARQEYILLTGNDVKQVGFIKHPEIKAGASPDGQVGTDGLIEIKCPDSSTHLDTLLTGKIPTQYQLQMLMQMWVTERQWCDFVSYDPRVPQNLQLFVKRYARNDIMIGDMKAKVVQFLKEVDAEVDKLLGYKTTKPL